MLTKEDIATAKEIAKVLRESEVNELTVARQLITVLLAEREQQRTWVDMTDEEILAAPKNLIACIAYVRNKLNEKNGTTLQANPVDIPKLIGWRTEDYLMETCDINQAKNWEVHYKILPIFEGDTNTKLTTHPVAPQGSQGK